MTLARFTTYSLFRYSTVITTLGGSAAVGLALTDHFELAIGLGVCMAGFALVSRLRYAKYFRYATGVGTIIAQISAIENAGANNANATAQHVDGGGVENDVQNFAIAETELLRELQPPIWLKKSHQRLVSAMADVAAEVGSAKSRGTSENDSASAWPSLVEAANEIARRLTFDSRVPAASSNPQS